MEYGFEIQEWNMALNYGRQETKKTIFWGLYLTQTVNGKLKGLNVKLTPLHSQYICGWEMGKYQNITHTKILILKRFWSVVVWKIYKWRNGIVFTDLLVETENISPSRYKKNYFFMFPAAHYRLTPWKPAYSSLHYWTLQFQYHLMVMFICVCWTCYKSAKPLNLFYGFIL